MKLRPGSVAAAVFLAAWTAVVLWLSFEAVEKFERAFDQDRSFAKAPRR